MRIQTDQKQVRVGASAFIDMLEAVKARTEADLEAHVQAGGNDIEDARDYPAIVSLIDAALQAHVTDAPPLHRQGFLRALAYMQTPDAYQHPDVLARIFGSIRAITDDAENYINATAGEFGCDHKDKEWLARMDARRLAAEAS